MATIADIEAILASGNLTPFVGRVEDHWFDAKRSAGYNLKDRTSQIELAKDVSAFANAEGGLIVIGLEPEPAKPDAIKALDLIPETAFDRNAISGLLGEFLYPVIEEVDIRWVEDKATKGLGVGVIQVPTLPRDDRFVLMRRVIDEGVEIKQIVFGYAVRQGAHTKVLTIEEIHRICQHGRTSVAERLYRIEGKLDQVLSRLPSGGANTASQPALAALKKLIGEIQ
jgi:hypothetical protein